MTSNRIFPPQLVSPVELGSLCDDVCFVFNTTPSILRCQTFLLLRLRPVTCFNMAPLHDAMMKPLCSQFKGCQQSGEQLISSCDEAQPPSELGLRFFVSFNMKMYFSELGGSCWARHTDVWGSPPRGLKLSFAGAAGGCGVWQTAADDKWRMKEDLDSTESWREEIFRVTLTNYSCQSDFNHDNPRDADS